MQIQSVPARHQNGESVLWAHIATLLVSDRSVSVLSGIPEQTADS